MHIYYHSYSHVLSSHTATLPFLLTHVSMVTSICYSPPQLQSQIITFVHPHLSRSLVPSTFISLTPSVTHSLSHSYPQRSSHSLPHTLTHSLTHTLHVHLTHSLTHSVVRFIWWNALSKHYEALVRVAKVSDPTHLLSYTPSRQTHPIDRPNLLTDTSPTHQPTLLNSSSSFLLLHGPFNLLSFYFFFMVQVIVVTQATKDPTRTKMVIPPSPHFHSTLWSSLLWHRIQTLLLALVPPQGYYSDHLG